jgi:Sec-independent protein translocase protein TatA
MGFELSWFEVAIVSGLILLGLGPERLLEFQDDLEKLWNDFRAVFRRGRA